MKERERILDLVKKGVLSTEEALVLLENMTNAAQHQNAAKDASDMDAAADKVRLDFNYRNDAFFYCTAKNRRCYLNCRFHVRDSWRNG